MPERALRAGGRHVFLLKGYPRLSETFIAQEILGLERAGLPISIFAMRRSTDKTVHPITHEIAAPVSWLPEYLHDEPARVFRALFAAMTTWRLLPAVGALLRDLPGEAPRNRLRRFGQALVLAHEMPADVLSIHAHFLHTPASVARYAALLRGVPWSCSAHAKDIWTSRPRDLAIKLAHARWVTTCTRIGRDYLATLAPAGKPVALIYHGIDLRRFPPLTAPRPRRDGSRADDPVRVLSVGRAVEKKGLDTLIDALAALPSDLHWRWKHIGGGEQLEKLQRRAAQRGIDGRIEWSGPQAQDAVLAACRAADLFVLPCRVAADGDRDGLPNVLMEAQSQSVASISTRVSAIPELIADGVTGLLVPPDDSDALAQMLRRAMVDPDLRFRIGRAGARRVQQDFGHEKGIARLMRSFEVDNRWAATAEPATT